MKMVTEGGRAIALRNGVRVPTLGLGTYRASGQDVSDAVYIALKAGIRHLDTAAVYRNEALVQEGISRSGVPRDKIFVVSKLAPFQQGADKARQGAHDMINVLGGVPVDLALIHWPGASGKAVDSADNARLRLETWRVMEEFYDQGLFRSIGVSNYEIHHLQELMSVAKVQPMVNQIEVHPRRPNTALRNFCSEHGIIVTAYSPLGQGDLVESPVVKQLAVRYDKAPAQILVRWSLAKGCLCIPKSVKSDRIQEFATMLDQDWDLDNEAVAALDALDDGHKYCWNPEVVA